MKQKSMKPSSRKSRSGKVILITAVVFLFAGAAAIIIPVADESEALNRDESAYEELAEELKMPQDVTSFPDEEKEAPQTEPIQEKPDTTAIHPPSENETCQPETADEDELSTMASPQDHGITETPGTVETAESTAKPIQRLPEEGSPALTESHGNTGANLKACVKKNPD